MNKNCPNCFSKNTEIFWTIDKIPVNSCLLLSTYKEAKEFPTGKIRLSFCRHCVFIFNDFFDPSLTAYGTGYEETQGFSATFKDFHQKLVTQLVEKYRIRDKHIIDIGCGKGEFLMALCQEGNNSGLGFDPAWDADRFGGEIPENVTFIKDFYSSQYSYHQADVYCCKMTLEHIANTRLFLRMLREAIGNNYESLIFFQVPDGKRIFRDCAFEDIYYEHCSYFNEAALRMVFALEGFKIDEITSVFGGQYLTLIARPVMKQEITAITADQNYFLEITALIESFQHKMIGLQKLWEDRFEHWAREGKKVVFWGGGSKAVAMLAFVQATKMIDYVVDINPYRQGSYLPFTGLKIISPKFLEDYHPDVIVIMNEMYKAEISEDVYKMDLHPEIFTL